jgi:hypothetical protein
MIQFFGSWENIFLGLGITVIGFVYFFLVIRDAGK